MHSVTATALGGQDETLDASGHTARTAARLGVVVLGAVAVTFLFWLLTATTASAAEGGPGADAPTGPASVADSSSDGAPGTSTGAATGSPAAPAEPPASASAPAPGTPAPPAPAPVEQPPAPQSPAPVEQAPQPAPSAPVASTPAGTDAPQQTSPTSPTSETSQQSGADGVTMQSVAPAPSNPVEAVASQVRQTVASLTGADRSASASSVGRVSAASGPLATSTGYSPRRQIVPAITDALLATIDRTVTTVTGVVRRTAAGLVATVDDSLDRRLGLHPLLTGLVATTGAVLDDVDGISPTLQHSVDVLVTEPPAEPSQATPVPGTLPAGTPAGHVGSVGTPSVVHSDFAAGTVSAPIAQRAADSISIAPTATAIAASAPASAHGVGSVASASSYDVAVPALLGGDGGGSAPAGASGGSGGGVAAALRSPLLPGTSGLTTSRSEVFTMPGSPNFLPGHSPD